MSVKATCLGYPRIGADRELKKALERYWSTKIPATALENIASKLRRQNWQRMQHEGISPVPCNDFSLYDHMLDMAVCVGAVPPAYQPIPDPLTRYFAMARGYQDTNNGIDVPALQMTKWFDTNYHYIVPELAADQVFKLDATKILSELKEMQALGIAARPVIPGPVTFLLLSKLAPSAPSGAHILQLLPALIDVFAELLSVLAAEKVEWVQLDEPCLVLDLDEAATQAYRNAFARLSAVKSRPKILLTTYFAGTGASFDLVAGSGFEGCHVDLVRAPDQLDRVLNAIPTSMLLSLGVINGRNIWRTDLHAAHAVVRRAVSALGEHRVAVAPSCSLLHVPVELEAEHRMDDELKGWLAFATQKLGELRALADMAGTDTPVGPAFDVSRAARTARETSTRINNPAVQNRMKKAAGISLSRPTAYAERAAKQRVVLELPFLPTTTIGSFPQTKEVRSARAARRSGRLSEAEYQSFLEDETRRCVERQEAIGLDVLVHGEFERSDMVEYFGEQLDGFVFSDNGWVQSYGSRCVKPPIIFGDVSRPKPMTVDWSRFAQALTSKPMKGMLTGPVTILQWSFVRDDQPRAETCRQIALALRDEVLDLESAGIRMIQVDEAAIREGLPINRSEWPAYLRWAVDAFRLTTGGVKDETQIHTHMCYAEFGDILGAVAEMDADVLSIETSRSKMALLADFADFRYPNEIGPGVYDIHSPRIPTAQEMVDLLKAAAQVVPANQLWVNPDCGLKTRRWSEVEDALKHMVDAARRARELIVPDDAAKIH